ncbi:hypothetical protein RRG08_050117 [Elysia crispata]|uniref:Uncharacterized protein n=1 Tax=Elysia crispata TaxID=231223 RepID=A0AAE0Z646_9GAST|nr:hypothetical protein RRG08_050117 [Elysia crispata]
MQCYMWMISASSQFPPSVKHRHTWEQTQASKHTSPEAGVLLASHFSELHNCRKYISLSEKTCSVYALHEHHLYCIQTKTSDATKIAL